MSLISEKDSTIKIRTCRICLDANRVDMVLIEEQNGWLRRFEFCFGFTLTTQDQPRLMCKICAEKVQGYVEFKEKCLQSHSLWKSVISDVKCYVVKHQNGENTNENASDPATNKTQIKDETFDPYFDNDTHYSNLDDSEIDNLSPTEIKTEFHEEGTKTRDDENNMMKKKDCIRIKADSKLIDCKNFNSHGSVKSKENEIYTCTNCKVKYARKVCYLKHIKVCPTKISRKRNFSQDYAYDLGRQYNGQNIDKVKHETQIEIIGNQDQNVSSSSCGLCNLSFATTKEVCIHLNDHWSNNELACKLCGFVGIDLAATVVHRYSHFPRKDILRFLCHICEKNQQSLMALHFHYRREHLKKPGGYCSRCHKEYNKLRLWKKHELTHCARKHVCDICGKGFHFKHSIREHIINHMQLKKSICDICGKAFTRQSYMKVHKETVHCESGPIKCFHCNRTFKSEFSLNKHQKDTINREKTLECEVCHKTFITPNRLKLHMVMHSHERPYSCNICSCSYKYKSQLTNHQRKHFGFFPQCSICTKTFSDSMSLKRHSAVHTGVRQYNCSVTNCTRTFYSKKLMLAHLELRHKDEISEKSEILCKRK